MSDELVFIPKPVDRDALVPRDELERGLRVAAETAQEGGLFALIGTAKAIAGLIVGTDHMVAFAFLIGGGVTMLGIGLSKLIPALQARSELRRQLLVQELPAARLLEK